MSAATYPMNGQMIQKPMQMQKPMSTSMLAPVTMPLQQQPLQQRSMSARGFVSEPATKYRPWGRSAVSSNCTTPTMVSPCSTPAPPLLSMVSAISLNSANSVPGSARGSAQTAPGQLPSTRISSSKDMTSTGGSLRSTLRTLSSLPTTAGSVCSGYGPQSKPTSPYETTFGAPAWEPPQSSSKGATPQRINSFSLASPRSSYTETSAGFLDTGANAEQEEAQTQSLAPTPRPQSLEVSPQPVPVILDSLSVSEKAHQGRLLLTMSLQGVSFQDQAEGKQHDDAALGTDKTQDEKAEDKEVWAYIEDEKDEKAEDKQVWAASVGGILLMLSPLLIL